MKYEKYKYLGFLGLLSLIGLKGFVTHNYLWFILFINYNLIRSKILRLLLKYI